MFDRLCSGGLSKEERKDLERESDLEPEGADNFGVDFDVFRLPSWWFNPNISSNFLRRTYTENKSNFNVEFGSEFRATSGNWLPVHVMERHDELAADFVARDTISYSFGGQDLGFSRDSAALVALSVTNSGVVKHPFFLYIF